MVAKRHSHFGVLFRVFTVIEAVAEPRDGCKGQVEVGSVKELESRSRNRSRSDQIRPDQTRPVSQPMAKRQRQTAEHANLDKPKPYPSMSGEGERRSRTCIPEFWLVV